MSVNFNGRGCGCGCNGANYDGGVNNWAGYGVAANGWNGAGWNGAGWAGVGGGFGDNLNNLNVGLNPANRFYGPGPVGVPGGNWRYGYRRPRGLPSAILSQSLGYNSDRILGLGKGLRVFRDYYNDDLGFHSG